MKVCKYCGQAWLPNVSCPAVDVDQACEHKEEKPQRWVLLYVSPEGISTEYYTDEVAARKQFAIEKAANNVPLLAKVVEDCA